MRSICRGKRSSWTWLLRHSPVSPSKLKITVSGRCSYLHCHICMSLGAADTTLAVVMSFIAAILLSPETQRTAHKELDGVLNGRLPSFDDEPSLPYISAVVKEVLRYECPISDVRRVTTHDLCPRRWGVVAPIGTPILLFHSIMRPRVRWMHAL